jgi:hypothetical protein
MFYHYFIPHIRDMFRPKFQNVIKECHKETEVKLTKKSLSYITLHFITLHYITLRYMTLHYITIQTQIITSFYLRKNNEIFSVSVGKM